MSDTKTTSEKIFDILGSLVADPFRRWFIVGYVIFNPDFFVLFFTSKEKFEIFEQYFKLQYCPWLSFFAEYSGLWYFCYKIAFPLLFAVFWCFIYPLFEILYRKYITNKYQNKIKDIKDNNILQTKIKELNNDLIHYKKLDNLILSNYNDPQLLKSNDDNEHIMFYFKQNNTTHTTFILNDTPKDYYEHCIRQAFVISIKNHFNFKTDDFLYIDKNVDQWSKEQCSSFLTMIKKSFNPHNNRDINIHDIIQYEWVNKSFIILLLYRLNTLDKN